MNGVSSARGWMLTANGFSHKQMTSQKLHMKDAVHEPVPASRQR